MIIFLRLLKFGQQRSAPVGVSRGSFGKCITIMQTRKDKSMNNLMCKVSRLTQFAHSHDDAADAR